MLEQLASIFTVVSKKIAPAPLLALAIASAAILFSPGPLAERVGVDEFRVTYRGWIGGALVASVSYLLALLILWLCGLYISHRRKKIALAKGVEYLRGLTAEEKWYLAPYVLAGVTSQTFQLQDGIAGGLLKKGVLYRPTPAGHMIRGFAHNIRPWALEYLQEHPELLGGASPH